VVSVKFLLLFFLLHFLGDWLFQPREIATKKSSDPLALRHHMSTYGMFMLCIGFVMPPMPALGWWLTNMVAHSIQDWYLYQIFPKVLWWDNGNRAVNSRILVTIGLDQFIHYSVAVITYAVFMH